MAAKGKCYKNHLRQTASAVGVTGDEAEAADVIEDRNAVHFFAGVCIFSQTCCAGP